MPRGAAAALTAVAGLCLVLSAGRAHASRASLDGRGLPRLLAVDETMIVEFPGSAARFGRRVLLDAAGTGPADAFGMVLLGSSWRYGYLVDQDLHNLFLASPGGFGAVVGFRNDDFERRQRASGVSSRDRRWDRTFRVGLGWSAASPERMTGVGAAFSYRDAGDVDAAGSAPRMDWESGETSSPKRTATPGPAS